MQTAAYTITPREAEVIRDLIAFVGEDVFDRYQKNGIITKSDAFQRRISEARSVMKGMGAYNGSNLKENHHG